MMILYNIAYTKNEMHNKLQPPKSYTQLSLSRRTTTEI